MQFPRLLVSFVLVGALGANVASAPVAAPCANAAAPVLKLAAADTTLGVVSKTRNSATFLPGTSFEMVQRDGKTLVLVTPPPGTAHAGGTINCTCDGGTCFPSQQGNKVVCTSHAGQCDKGCGMTIIAGPPPAPDP